MSKERLTAPEWEAIHRNCSKCGVGICDDHLDDFLNFRQDSAPPAPPAARSISLADHLGMIRAWITGNSELWMIKKAILSHLDMIGELMPAAEGVEAESGKAQGGPSGEREGLLNTSEIE